MKIQLTKEWTLGASIDKGGFGKVYEAKSDDEPNAVAKLVPKAPGASRELLFVDVGDARNVVPIIDSGEHEDYWVLVMPRAEMSLLKRIRDANGPISTPDALAILTDIATALADLDGHVVHRDLKPGNVLLLNGHWCLADFGISRYAEATTAPDTHKYAMSPPYAAPERWRSERATIAADVYALGVMAHELLTGTRPFDVSGPDDWRERHLHAEPKSLEGVSAGLAALIDECLYKAPGARPGPANVLARLTRLAQAAPSGGLASLQEANRAEVQRRGEDDRRDSSSRSESERRADLLASAKTSFQRIADQLRTAVMDAAPSVRQAVRPGGSWVMRFGLAEFRLTAPRATAANPWQGWEAPPFDVVVHAELNVWMPRDQYEYEGRSHSLWYCDAQQKGRYQWFETAFMVSAFVPRRGLQNPFALDPGEDAAKALWMGIAELQVAWPFTALTVGELDDFISRWASWFAAASQGRLQHPRTLPEHPPEGSWWRN
ncbi:serine/threonine protein kinase [Phytohabitans suffuscus]|uniref:Protein kinase domain-containing protein n=1 Tax=Phytohabitans suffuscus TaxID=624315 RepID=A0A6F8YE96_9ACTN|nr:serine/threonine-protein kinase [Phytohabitans suffuscus]BCB84445.1 hypothetical protein Psuf_017580 [Phytohabitans suffuscus]